MTGCHLYSGSLRSEWGPMLDLVGIVELTTMTPKARTFDQVTLAQSTVAAIGESVMKDTP